jgi:hypothetical protein
MGETQPTLPGMEVSVVQPVITPIPAPPLPPKTTEQEDMTLKGQRDINRIWEYTQSIIALVVTTACVTVGVHIGFSDDLSHQIPSILSNAFFLIVGFYFSRTNHTAIGGLGRKANEIQYYEGR